jgi:hypothetical protein
MCCIANSIRNLLQVANCIKELEAIAKKKGFSVVMETLDFLEKTDKKEEPNVQQEHTAKPEETLMAVFSTPEPQVQQIETVVQSASLPEESKPQNITPDTQETTINNPEPVPEVSNVELTPEISREEETPSKEHLLGRSFSEELSEAQDQADLVLKQAQQEPKLSESSEAQPEQTVSETPATQPEIPPQVNTEDPAPVVEDTNSKAMQRKMSRKKEILEKQQVISKSFTEYVNIYDRKATIHSITNKHYKKPFSARVSL